MQDFELHKGKKESMQMGEGTSWGETASRNSGRQIYGTHYKNKRDAKPQHWVPVESLNGALSYAEN